MTRRRVFVAVVAAVIALAAAGGAAQFEEKWVFYTGSIIEGEDADGFIALMQRAAKAGYTHVLLDDVYLQTAGDVPPKYFENTARVKKAAEKAGVIVVPGIFNVGYSWRVLYYDSDLAAGLPVEDQPFIVKDGVARPDPAAVPEIANPGFDEEKEGAVASWHPSSGGGPCVSVDTAVKHSGAASLRMTDFDKLPEEARGECRVMQRVKVEPFKYYRLTMWRKSDGLRADGTSVMVKSGDGFRRLCYTNFESESVGQFRDYVTADADWRRFHVTFNTLESTEMEIGVGLSGARGGTVWWDEVAIEPAGLANVLRRDATPFVVKSADGSVTYEEGRDFKAVADVKLGRGEMPEWICYLPPGGSYDVWHEGPGIVLTSKSAIKNGERLLVSYYHPHIIYGHQVNCSISDPKVLELFEVQMRWMKKLWDAPAYVISYDEVRVGGWEKQPEGADLTSGQLLAKQARAAYDIIRKYSPDAKIYVWSDMFDPYHNAGSFEQRGRRYYLVKGDYEGSWEGLPEDVTVLYWGPMKPDGLRHFASRGHKLIVSGYGGAGRPVGERIQGWMKAGEGIPEVIGFIYTTYEKEYDDLEKFSRTIDEQPQVK